MKMNTWSLLLKNTINICQQQSGLNTLTFDTLGNKTPEEIGTEITPVWTFECMQLQQHS